MKRDDISVGMRVRVGSIHVRKHDAPAIGTVTGIDDKSRPGVSVRFDYLVNGGRDCYATYDELTREARS